MAALTGKRLLLIGVVLLALVAGYAFLSETPRAAGEAITVYKSPT